MENLNLSCEYYEPDAQCAQNAKIGTNEGSFEFKLCNALVETIHNRFLSILNALGGHFNNISILA